MIAPASPAPAASATPAAIVGPCSQGAIASIADRPGVGRALTVNGSPCVVPVGGVVLELGFRQQMTHAAAAVSTLVTYPQPLVRWGIGGGNEIVLAPSLDYSQRYGANLEVAPFVPASGLQDAGLGFKRQLEDRPWFQSALEAFVTLPTGYPQGPNGFSAGMVAYLVGYSVIVPVGAVISLTTTQNLHRRASSRISRRSASRSRSERGVRFSSRIKSRPRPAQRAGRRTGRSPASSGRFRPTSCWMPSTK